MKHKRFVLPVLIVMLVIIAALPATSAMAQYTFTCADGTEFTNTVTLGTNIRPGQYTVTAMGINGFDPVLAVWAPDSQEAICNDDDSVGATYFARLPTTGDVPPNNRNARIIFSNTTNDFMNIEFYVGGLGGSTGEFLLVFEGMQYTTADGAGDPFAIGVDAAVISSGIPVAAYAIANTTSLDPKITLTDADNNPIIVDGQEVSCDDAGNSSLCFGLASSPDGSLEGAAIGAGDDGIPGGPLDAALIIDTTGFDPSVPQEESFFNYTVASYNRQTTGPYTMIFHIGVGDGVGGTTATTNNSTSSNTTSSTNNSSSNTTSSTSTNTTTSSGSFDAVLNYGDSLQGTMGSETGAVFGFQGTTGDVVTINAASTEFDGLLLVYGPDGTEVARDDDSGEGTNPRVSNFRIPASGTYVIVLSAFNNNTPVGSAFTISLENRGGGTSSTTTTTTTTNTNTNTTISPTNTPSGSAAPLPTSQPNNTTSNTTTTSSGSTIAYGDAVIGSIDTTAGVTLYTFTAAAGDAVTIALTATSNYTPVVAILNASQQPLVTQRGAAGQPTATISNFQIPAAGTYTIAVANLSAPGQGGNFSLVLIGS
jgi:hypothetical protein